MPDTMDATVVLSQGDGVWCLHVLTNQAVSGPGDMGTANPSGTGTNTDVQLQFSVSTSTIDEDELPAAEEDAPFPFTVPWSKATILTRNPDNGVDNAAHRGTYWARIIPAAFEDHVFVQLAQVGYVADLPLKAVTFRLFSGRLHTRGPVQFFGHGAGNEGGQNLSFTLTQGECH